MAVDPRTFTVKQCDVTGRKLIRNTTAKKGFLEGLGKVGDLEVLNKVGYGKVGEGLRTLAATSDSVRLGDNNAAVKAAQGGSAYVFEETGLNEQDVSRVSQFNPGVANRAQAQAEAIAEKVSQGNFELSDIPETFSDLQNFGNLVDGIFPGGANQNDMGRELCGASPYAMSLIQHSPKFKFLFVVQVEFNAPYASDPVWNYNKNGMAFVVKHSTRPNVEFEYEEINQYNYRTRVPKRTIYPPITMRFYDDTLNFTSDFFVSYLNAMSPISNMGARYGETAMMDPEWLAANSMSNGESNRYFSGVRHSGASLGALHERSGDPDGSADGAPINIIKNIKLFHVYDSGNFMNVYNFHNPKILSFSNDDLDMSESGNGSELEFQFAYDALYVETNYSLQQAQGSGYDIKTLSSNNQREVWALDPIFGGDDELKQKEKPTSQDENIVVKAGSAVTGAISGVIDAGTGLVSKAFDAVNDFGGSIFK